MIHTLKQLTSIIANQIQDIDFEQMKYIHYLINSAQDSICDWSWCNFRVFAHELTAGQATYNLWNCPSENQDAIILVEDVLAKDPSSNKYTPLAKKSMFEINRIKSDWWASPTATRPIYAGVDKDFLLIVPASDTTITDGLIITARAKADVLVNDADVCKLHSQYHKYIVDFCLLTIKNDLAGLIRLEQFLRLKRQEKMLRLERVLEVKNQML